MTYFVTISNRIRRVDRKTSTDRSLTPIKSESCRETSKDSKKIETTLRSSYQKKLS